MHTKDLDVCDDEIAQELKFQGVLDIQRIVTMKDSKHITTGPYILRRRWDGGRGNWDGGGGGGGCGRCVGDGRCWWM